MSTLNLSSEKARYLKARDAYYNSGVTTMSDNQFDALEDLIRTHEPEWPELKKTGSKVGKKFSAPLLINMPSLDKIQSDNLESFGKWLKSEVDGSQVIVTPKYDGSSVQLVYENGVLTQVITRGDGITGKDVSHFIPYLRLPDKVPGRERFVVRAEAILSNSDFKRFYSKDFDSARALSSSILNRTDVSIQLKRLQFIALGILSSKDTYREQLINLSRKGFSTPPFKGFQRTSSSSVPSLATLLEKYLEEQRKESDFNLDGLVLRVNASNQKISADRPAYAKAFKVNSVEDAPETTITEIRWQLSAHGTLVPKAIVSPIDFDGVTVKQVALHNAKWAMDRGCGVGARVKVLRSGEIIPKIVEVIAPSEFKLPPKSEYDWNWDKTQTHLVVDSAEATRVQRFTRFFTKLDMEFMSKDLAAKLADVYEETWMLAHLTVEDFAALPGVKTSAKKYAAQLDALRSSKPDVRKLMVASGCFGKGMGSSRLAMIPINTKYLAPKQSFSPDDLVRDVPGFGPENAALYCEGYIKFSKWLSKTGLGWHRPAPEKTVKGVLNGQTFAWTGYRNKDEEAYVVSLGGEVTNWGKSTTVLFYSPTGKASTKVSAAGSKAKVFATWKKSL